MEKSGKHGLRSALMSRSEKAVAQNEADLGFHFGTGFLSHSQIGNNKTPQKQTPRRFPGTSKGAKGGYLG